jgi:hypothetical protein
VYPRCPEHQAANLTGKQLTGAAVNGPNGAERFAELNRFPTMRPCVTAGFARFDGHGARFVDDDRSSTKDAARIGPVPQRRLTASKPAPPRR